jgi:hypothetical protein
MGESVDQGRSESGDTNKTSIISPTPKQPVAKAPAEEARPPLNEVAQQRAAQRQRRAERKGA